MIIEYTCSCGITTDRSKGGRKGMCFSCYRKYKAEVKISRNELCTVCHINPVYARGLCTTHVRTGTLSENEKWLHSRNEFIMRAAFSNKDECIEYPLTKVKGRPKTHGIPTARVVLGYRTLGIQNGFVACHSCDNDWCVNGKHLYWGTHKQNTRDAVVRDRIMGYRRKLTHEEREYIKTSSLTIDEVVTLFPISRVYASQLLAKGGWSKS